MRYEFIGWQRDEKENIDKVWGVIMLKKAEKSWDDCKFVTFWGRRGKKLSTKIVEQDLWSMRKDIGKKENKGYNAIDENKLDTVYPEFQRDLEKTAVWAMLKG